MIRRSTPIRRNVVPIRRPQAKHAAPNEHWRKWLRSWPCFICFRQHCLNYSIPLLAACSNPEAREYYKRNWSLEICGKTEAAHVGSKGTGQKCAERDMMPLGLRHHRHPTDGGFPDSHHAGTRTFWGKHGIERLEVLDMLRGIYFVETGREI